MQKKRMTTAEQAFVDCSLAQGCIICGAPAQWHHLPMARVEGAHCIGWPACPEHHTGQEFPGQSIHSNRLLFTQKYGTELRLMQKNLLRVFDRSIPF